MTDTGQVPGEGLPESAGMVEQPGVPAHGAYHYLSDAPAQDEDLLLPGAQGAWGNEVPPPAPEPVVEAVHEPGPHETAGRDSGSVDLSGVRPPGPAPVSAAASPILSAPHDQAAPAAPRRPLHLGPPIPDASASPVRSLADRGPAGAPVRHSGPPTTGPEYLDVQSLRDLAPQSAAPWGAPHVPVPQAVGLPAPAEAVAPVGSAGPGLAQHVVPRLAPGAVVAGGTGMTDHAAQAAVAATAEQPVTGQEPHAAADAHPGHGHDGVYAVAGTATPGGPESGNDPEDGPVPDPAPTAAALTGADGTLGAQTTLTAPETALAEGTPAAEAAPPQQDPAAQAAQAGPEGGAQAPFPEAPLAGQALSPEAPLAPQAGVAPEGAPHTDPAQPVAQLPEPDGLQQAAPAAGQPGAVPVPPAEPAPLVAGPVPAASTADGIPTPAAGTPTPAAGTPVPAVPQHAAADHAVPAEGAHPGQSPQQTPPQAPTGPTAEAGPHGADTGAPAALAPEDPVADEGPVPAVPAHEADGPQFAPHRPETAEPPQNGPGPQNGPDAQPAPGAVAPPDAQAAPGIEPAPAPADAARPEPPTAEAPADTPAAPGNDAYGPEGSGTDASDGGTPAEGTLTEGTSVEGAPVEGTPVEGTPVESTPAEGTPSNAAPGAGTPAEDAPGEQTPLSGTVTAVPDGDQSLGHSDGDQSIGHFVPVDGTVPTTPHLAPTPPQPLVLPAQDQGEPQPAPAAPRQPVVTVPGPREAEPAQDAPDVVQQAEDLRTRAADQEDGTGEETRRPTGPAAPGYEDAEREAVLKVMRERRDIRNGFRSDPIPHEVLLRVLEAAHTAPSVGHSQPWDFVVIRSPETRHTMHELAMRQRDAYAKSLPKGRAKQFKELKIEAILDTPVNIVVTADPTRGGRHTLGRHTQPQMAPYSSALAVENLWLAARAEGLGVGWVSFFDEREMVRALGLPEHLEVVAYLCVGYVDEFPDEPELTQSGWSKRRPLSWVVHEETYGRRALPGEDPHDLLAETVAGIRPLDAKALGEAWERQKRMTKPAGALGMLEIISAQLSGLSRQCPPPIPEPAAVAVFAGDHGVHAQGVTPWPQEVTAQMVANFLGGGAVCNAFAAQVGAEVCVIDVGVATDLPATPGLLPRKVRAGTSDMTTGPAMSREEVKQAIEVGIETARDLVAAGNKALLTGEMGIANTTASAALIAVFTGVDPAEVTGRGTGINDETLARKTEVVRRALELHQPDPADPIGVLAAVGGLEHAAMVGLLLGGASLRTPVILDGVSAGAAALVARAIAPEVLAACIAGHRSAEPGHVAALNKLGLRPLVDLDLRLGEGTGALLALPLVQSTARAMHEVATFDSAGVTEK
ncbi:nicotinate-nucleotide--dimethylbenzimidazole phosphoribosyltransferase [Streptomyces sp. NPDC001508]|uniref:nicotinate-nucleotide--dimethylbenzimidazole phosphoribosyltransferase n=1 Tax=Streptomyces sp. NPDC001508 TaxID=3154656 RepID=UPI0033167FDF